MRIPIFLHSHQHFILHVIFKKLLPFSMCVWYLSVVSILYLSISFHVLIGYLCTFTGEMSNQVLYPFLHWVTCLFIIEFKSCLHIPDTRPYQIYNLQMFFFHFLSCFLSFFLSSFLPLSPYIYIIYNT